MPKVMKKRKAEKVAEATAEPTTKEEYIVHHLKVMMNEIDNYDFDGLNDVETRQHLGKIGQRYAMMGAEMSDGRAVIGYKRVFKIMLLGQTPEEAAKGRG